MAEVDARDPLGAAAASLVRVTGTRPHSLDWDEFDRLTRVTSEFQVPHSTFTPLMCGLLWAIARTRRPMSVVGLGTYVGWTFAWLAGLASFEEAPTHLVSIDVDPDACGLAALNLAALGHGRKLTVACEDAARTAWRGPPIDILFIDVDDPVRGKSGYAPLLAAWIPRLSRGALILGHDVCVPRFSRDFDEWRRVASTKGLKGPYDMAIDACGVSVLIR